MGPALDHDRHQPRRPGARPHAADGRRSSRTTCSPTRPRASKKEAELTGQDAADATRPTDDIRKGFVYKRVPHVTLKTIANNPDIREGMTRAEIDAAIARHAETETLYDQPYEDKKPRPRHRAVHGREPLARTGSSPTDEERPASEPQARSEPGRGDFATMILDNLRKAGRPEHHQGRAAQVRPPGPYAGAWIHATGDYTDADGKTRRVAVSIGPEHGTVGPAQVKEAAKEAVQGVGFDLLIVCGFAFDPHVSEEAKRYGKLTVLPARMNPDLADGRRLLKKTGAGNLFMVFGEPDIEITRDADGKLVVEIKGLDVYDPTTGADPQLLDRRHRLLVHRHRLQRRELLRPPRLLHRRRRPLRASSSAPSGPRSTKPPGQPSTARRAAPSTRPSRARSP